MMEGACDACDAPGASLHGRSHVVQWMLCEGCAQGTSAQRHHDSCIDAVRAIDSRNASAAIGRLVWLLRDKLLHEVRHQGMVEEALKPFMNYPAEPR